MKLVDMPDAERMAVRELVENMGIEITGYALDSFMVAMPRPVPYAALDAAGFEIVPGSMHYFPLGSDVNWTADNMRHDGSYPKSRGFWLFARVRKPA